MRVLCSALISLQGVLWANLNAFTASAVTESFIERIPSVFVCFGRVAAIIHTLMRLNVKMNLWLLNTVSLRVWMCCLVLPVQPKKRLKRRRANGFREIADGREKREEEQNRQTQTISAQRSSARATTTYVLKTASTVSPAASIHLRTDEPGLKEPAGTRLHCKKLLLRS